MNGPLPALLPPLRGLGELPARTTAHLPAGTTPPTPPLTTLPRDRESDICYGFARLDRDGRMHTRAVTPALGWQPGATFSATSSGLSIVFAESPDGRLTLDKEWHLRIPLALRESRRLASGVGVLLAADPSKRQLVVHPPAALDAIIANWAARTVVADHD